MHITPIAPIQGQRLMTPLPRELAAFVGGMAAMRFDGKPSGTGANGSARSFSSSDSKLSRRGSGSEDGNTSRFIFRFYSPTRFASFPAPDVFATSVCLLAG